MKTDTLCVHAGQGEEFANTPIFVNTATDYRDKPYLYPRRQNVPNQRVVIEKLAALEGGEDGLVFSSGMAAISTTFLALLRAGDHAVFQSDLYGGTHHFVHHEFPKYNMTFTLVDGGDVGSFERAIQPNTQMIYIETPSNPLLKITDIRRIAELARKRDIPTVIDNTFASPINQRPLAMGIDVVTHSATKYIAGHSDLSAGAVIASKAMIQRIYESAFMLGGTLNAADCYVLERSLKTLALRVRQHNHNALALAQWLRNQKGVRSVYYPGLAEHPGHAIAREQMTGFGGMLSFDLDATGTRPFINALRLIKPAISLGGVESTINAPVETSHQRLSAEERKRVGISDSLVRLSVGIEDVADLQDDIQQALRQVRI